MGHSLHRLARFRIRDQFVAKRAIDVGPLVFQHGKEG